MALDRQDSLALAKTESTYDKLSDEVDKLNPQVAPPMQSQIPVPNDALKPEISSSIQNPKFHEDDQNQNDDSLSGVVNSTMGNEHERF